MELKNKISYIPKLFRWSDLFLIAWVTFGILLFLEQYKFIFYTSADRLDFTLPFFVYVIYFTLMVIALIGYLFFEIKNYSMKIPLFVPILLFVILLSQILLIFLSPNNITLWILDIDEPYYFGAIAVFNLQVKIIHFFTMFFIIVTIFISIFIFTKRITDIRFVSFIIYCFYLLAFALFIYSLINDNYIQLFHYILFDNTNPDLKEACPSSVFGNPNMYGLFLETCFFLSIINFTITRRKTDIAFSAIFYLHLLLTLCIAGILATTAMVLVLLFIRALLAYKRKNKKQCIIYSSALCAALVTLLGIYLGLRLSGSFTVLFGKIGSFSRRIDIWYSAIQIIGQRYYILGYGYGIYNSLIANACGHYLFMNCPLSHNSLLSMLGEGGILYLIPFLALMTYTTIIVIKNINIDIKMAPLGCALYAIFIHMLFEDNYYVVITFAALIIMIKNINQLSDITN